jgi:hypothetical protein
VTITFGIRHSLAQTSFEVNGQQVSQDISMGKWFGARVAGAKEGNSVQPNFNYVLSGKANGGKPMWQMEKALIAPRVGLAYQLNIFIRERNLLCAHSGFGANGSCFY